MKCSEVEEKIWQVFDRETPEDEKNIVKSHIEECEECAQYYNEAKNMIETMRGFEKTKAPEGFTDRLKNRIISESHRKHIFTLRPALAFAASVVVIFLFMMTNKQQGALEYTAPGGNNIRYVNYEAASSFALGQKGYVKMEFNSHLDIDKVMIEIMLPDGLALVNGGKKTVWKGGLKKGKNTIVMEVEGKREGDWELKGIIKKNGLEKSFSRHINVT